MQKKLFFLFLILCFSITAFTQKDSAIYFKGAIKENRDKLRRNIIEHTITANLSFPLDEETEENWEDAFGGMELLRYRTPWTDTRISIAFDSIEKRSPDFQRALLELAYTGYRDRFVKQVTSLLKKTRNAKIFAMSAEYLLTGNANIFTQINLENKLKILATDEKDEAIIIGLQHRINPPPNPKNSLPVTVILDKNFLKGHTLLYSIQRKNRDFPGLALIRDTSGNFIKDPNGTIFSVPQLARSINNLPGYLTNGNTPQGIFRMYGFDTSKTYFIGPTTNIQLTMPFETSLRHFFNDSTITDTIWTEAWYQKLLPVNLKKYQPLYESFYAGKAGRTEIIAHGTTVDPAYYAHEIYYPQTPTMGCLCTKEIWSEENGRRVESDQQKLAMAIQRAGGADGYCVVIEIDDAQKPVTLDEILLLLKQ